MRLKERDVGRVPVVREVQAPLLDPSLPIGGADRVGDPEHGTLGVEQRDGSRFVGDAVVRPRDGQRIGRVVALDERVLLILHDHEPAGARVVEEARVVRDQRGIGLVRPAADHHRVEPREVTASERVPVQQLDWHADRGEGFGHAVRGASHVPDPR